MKNHFLISNEEKNRIRNLHESTKQSHGTGSLLKEAYNEYVSWETLEQNNERVVFFVGINNPNGRQGLNNPDSLVTENTHENYDKFINMIGADFQGPAGDRSGMRGAFVDSLGNIGIRARVQGNVEGGTFQCTIMFSKGSMIIENDDWF